MSNVVHLNSATLAQRLDAIRADTNDDHDNAITAARRAFDARLAQCVSYRIDQMLEAITSQE